MHAYVFPGQGSQSAGMAASLLDAAPQSRELFEDAQRILGYDLLDIMLHGSADDLQQTHVTQPAVFTHSVAAWYSLGADVHPDMVAGHSLGEFSALSATGVLPFSEGLQLVHLRAQAMQEACEATPSTMAAILGLEDDKVEQVCQNTPGTVVPANYNAPGQLVISGEKPAVEAACQAARDAGAKRAMLLPVGGAFHSPLMEPAREKLKQAIEAVHFSKPVCPVYQNVSAKAEQHADTIKENLIAQLTAPVRWSQSVRAMHADGAGHFTEVGPGKVLQGLVKKCVSGVRIDGVGS